MLTNFRQTPLAKLPTTSIASILSACSDEEVGNIARACGIEQGANKRETIRALTVPKGILAIHDAGLTVEVRIDLPAKA